MKQRARDIFDALDKVSTEFFLDNKISLLLYLEPGQQWDGGRGRVHCRLYAGRGLPQHPREL